MKRRALVLVSLPAVIGAAWLLLRAQNESAPHDRDPRPEDIPAARCIADPHPAFNGVAVDPENNAVVMTDTNRKSLLLYDRAAGSCCSTELTSPRRQIIGPATNI